MGSVHRVTVTFLSVASTNRYPESSCFCLFPSLSIPAFISRLETTMLRLQWLPWLSVSLHFNLDQSPKPERALNLSDTVYKVWG